MHNIIQQHVSARAAIVLTLVKTIFNAPRLRSRQVSRTLVASEIRPPFGFSLLGINARGKKRSIFIFLDLWSRDNTRAGLIAFCDLSAGVIAMYIRQEPARRGGGNNFHR